MWLARGGMVLFLALVFISELMSYRSTYRSAYKASAQGRANLAEHIRKLPLGFLMSKDPGELGHMMMSDFTQIVRQALGAADENKRMAAFGVRWRGGFVAGLMLFKRFLQTLLNNVPHIFQRKSGE